MKEKNSDDQFASSSSSSDAHEPYLAIRRGETVADELIAAIECSEDVEETISKRPGGHHAAALQEAIKNIHLADDPVSEERTASAQARQDGAQGRRSTSCAS